MLDAETDRAVPAAMVTLLEPGEVQGWSVVADSNGWFRIRLPSAGRFHFRVEAFGYAAAESGPLELRAGDGVEVELRLAVAPIAIRPLRVVSTRRIDERLERHGYYERQSMLEATGAYFLEAEEIRSRHSFSLEAVMRSLPGVRVHSDGGRAIAITNRRGKPLHVCLDGMPIGVPEVRLDALVPLSTIVAIEVYPNRSYLGRARCSLMIWTGMPDAPARSQGVGLQQRRVGRWGRSEEDRRRSLGGLPSSIGRPTALGSSSSHSPQRLPNRTSSSSPPTAEISSRSPTTRPWSRT